VSVRCCIGLVCVLLGWLPGLAWSQGSGPALVADRLADGAAEPVIDGRVVEDVWRSAVAYTDFTQQDPSEGAPATERTEVRVLVGRGNLFISVICFDTDPSRIIASQSRRDATLTDVDSIIVALDTFNDSQNAFIFGTNALGIQYDGQVASEGQTSGVQSSAGASTGRGGIGAFNANWDGDWDVKAQVTERGWEAEMIIPLQTLRYPTGVDRTWGFNVMRNIRHKNEQVYLAPIPRGFDIYRVSMAAKLGGLNLPGRRDISVTPYALGSVNKDYTRLSDQLDPNADVGFDLKWGSAAESDLRRNREHGLRAGRGRRRAGEPDTLRRVLSREAHVLPRECLDISVRVAAGDRLVLLPPDWLESVRTAN